MQMQADLLQIPVDRPAMVETTAFGAAALAGLSCGLWSGLDEVRALRRSDRIFTPHRTQADCDQDYRLWKRARLPCGGLDRALKPLQSAEKSGIMIKAHSRPI